MKGILNNQIEIIIKKNCNDPICFHSYESALV